MRSRRRAVLRFALGVALAVAVLVEVVTRIADRSTSGRADGVVNYARPGSMLPRHSPSTA